VRRLNIRARAIVVRTDTLGNYSKCAAYGHTECVMRTMFSAYKHSGCVRAVVECTDTVGVFDAECFLSVFSQTSICIQRKRLTDLSDTHYKPQQ